MKAQEIRHQFLKFFKERNHLIVPSASIVLKNDPTLMFNNSGMSQFKEYFLGNATPKNNRIADTQKCLRVSGKHNDLEDVGFDTYHHTMFEMLGNWSFGDYFKKEAIAWAWEFLTEILKIEKNRLYVSVFEGNPSENILFDQESWDIWKQYVSEDKIILGNKKDNFWEMGEQGPCGPCSEIHIDLRSDEERKTTSGKNLVNTDHPQVVEIWNIVFMEFNRKADGSLEKLPAKHVDTGMGFERLCMVMQGVTSNYDTDVFMPLIRKVEQITNFNYTNNNVKNITEEQHRVNIAIRVIVDHIRAVAFAIADGQLPSNTGAGYVIRRILRRAIRYGFTFLNQKQAFIYQLVEILFEQMSDVFPEIKTQKSLVENVIREEENSFLKTLEQGLQLLENVIKESKTERISGKNVFELYDTYGFPKDLTALILKEKKLFFDENEFETAMQQQKNRSKIASEITKDDWNVLIDGNIETFVGYDTLEIEAKITRFRKTESKKDGVLYQIVLDKTPFYPEGGGQIGDKGFFSSNNQTIEIIDTKKENNLIIHFTKQFPKDLNQTFTAKVNKKLRFDTQKNHSATHLLHYSLREILGKHVEQKGSLVALDYLRFDFSHFAKLTEEELQKVENLVNQKIEEQLPLVEKRAVPFEQAIEQGATALFGEKYSDSVRMIRFGKSIELCGGTHVKNTAEIWYFKITSESAVASGIRRIEAITGNVAKQYFKQEENTLNIIRQTFKNPQDIIKYVTTQQEENAKLKKQIEQFLKEKRKNIKEKILAEIEEINKIKFLARKIDLDVNGAKELAYELGQNHTNLFLVLATTTNQKPVLTCYISKELVENQKFNAVEVVRQLGKHIQGSGGGQPFFATAGGKNINGIDQALISAKDFVL